MAQALLIRPFVPEDQPAVRALILAGLGEHFGYIDETLNPDLDDISSSYLERGHSFFVVESGGALVGTGALLHEAPDRGRLARISVSETHRRTGVARLMVRHLLQRARQQGYRRVLVETNHDWYAALSLYLSEGFKEFDRDEESIHLECRLTQDDLQAGRRR